MKVFADFNNFDREGYIRLTFPQPKRSWITSEGTVMQHIKL